MSVECGAGGEHGQAAQGLGQVGQVLDLTDQDHGEDRVEERNMRDRPGPMELINPTGEEMTELDLTGINELCFSCVMVPCICILTKLTGILEELRKLNVSMDDGGSRKKLEEVRNQEQSGKFIIEDQKLVRKKRMHEEDRAESRQEAKENDEEGEDFKQGDDRRCDEVQLEEDQGQGHSAGAQEGRHDKVGGQEMGTRADCPSHDRTGPETPDNPYPRSRELGRRQAEVGAGRKKEDPGEEWEELVPSKYPTNSDRQEDGEKVAQKSAQRMTGTLPKQGRQAGRKNLRKKEDKKPVMRNRNIMEVMKMWQEKEQLEKVVKNSARETQGAGRLPPRNRLNPPQVEIFK